MKFGWRKFFLLITVILLGAFFCLHTVTAITDALSVEMEVVNEGNPDPPPPPDPYPSITGVVTSTSATAATILWGAADDGGITSQTFVYGITTSYGSSGTVVSGSNPDTYQTGLSGLTANTIYYFKISVTDSASQTTNYTGGFRTLSSDTSPPFISNLQVVPGMTTATISWLTDEPAHGEVVFNTEGGEGLTIYDPSLKISHSFTLTGLLPNTLYYYKVIVSDDSNNSTSNPIATFTTTKDSVRPPNVTGPTFATTTNAIVVSWTNPSQVQFPDFTGVKVLRKTGSPSTNEADGTVVYSGSSQSVSDTGFSFDTLYYYTILSFDTSNNTSTGAYASITYVTPTTPLTENCTNGIDDDGDGEIDCNDSDCASHSSCQGEAENCTNGIDDDGDGEIDCDDSDCASHSNCQQEPVVVEICNDLIDNDGDGAIDCADSDCAGFSACQEEPLSITPACQDKIDNDGDNLIDYPLDPGCDSPNDTDEYNPPTSTIPEFAKLNLVQVLFYLGDGKIDVKPVNSVVSGLSRSDLTVKIPVDKMITTPSSTVLRFNGTRNRLVLDAAKKTYYTRTTFSGFGSQQAWLEIDYGADQFDSISFQIKSLSFGDVFGEQNKRLSDVQLTLYKKNGQKMALDVYGQNNPYTTGVNGNYGWVVPNGEYYIVAQKSGYYERKTAVFTVSNNVINQTINLIVEPKKLKEVIDLDKPVTENVKEVAKNLGQKTKATTQRAIQGTKDVVESVQKVADNPEVEQVTRRVVAPAAVGVVAVGIVPFLSWANMLPFLRLLFLQPLMLIGWRRRRKWGLVYNALSKMPVDLAIVRLVDAKTGRLVQSKVTDRQGRYAFIVDPGEYKIEVKKDNFIFPTVLLKKYINDGRKTDIYHGEGIRVNEDRVVITANIPLDPMGEHKRPQRLVWHRLGRAVQSAISISGIIITAVSLYISPKIYIAVLLVLHIGMFFMFKRLSGPGEIKNWGIVYDKETRKPIGRVVARLFNTRFNKLISTQVTDRKGRYQFLAGDDEYYVTYEHANYKPRKAEVNLKGREEDVVDLDMPLQKKKPE